MNRARTIAALAVIGATSGAVAPSFAQDPSGSSSSSPSSARMATEKAAPSSGVMPAQPRQLGTKRTATSQEGPQLQSQKVVRPLSLSTGAAPKLPGK
jgi:hypothetical protein